MIEKITELIMNSDCDAAVKAMLDLDDKTFIETFAKLQANSDVKKKIMEEAREFFIDNVLFTDKVKQAISNKDNLTNLFKK